MGRGLQCDASYPSVDLGFVPRRREGLATILLDGCRVLLDGETGDAHHLPGVHLQVDALDHRDHPLPGRQGDA